MTALPALARPGSAPVSARMDAELRLWELWGYLTTAAGQGRDDLAYRTTLK